MLSYKTMSAINIASEDVIFLGKNELTTVYSLEGDSVSQPVPASSHGMGMPIGEPSDSAEESPAQELQSTAEEPPVPFLIFHEPYRGTGVFSDTYMELDMVENKGVVRFSRFFGLEGETVQLGQIPAVMKEDSQDIVPESPFTYKGITFTKITHAWGFDGKPIYIWETTDGAHIVFSSGNQLPDYAWLTQEMIQN